MEASIKHLQSLGSVGSETLHDPITSSGELETAIGHCQQPNGEGMHVEKDRCDGKKNATERLEEGHMQYGCSHYRRRCRIRAPCCNEVFDCRHCHNEAKNSINVERVNRHDLPRHQVEKVICSLCDTEQDVRQVCIKCGVCMGKYFCETCKLFDDDVSEQIPLETFFVLQDLESLCCYCQGCLSKSSFFFSQVADIKETIPLQWLWNLQVPY